MTAKCDGRYQGGHHKDRKLRLKKSHFFVVGAGMPVINNAIKRVTSERIEHASLNSIFSCQFRVGSSSPYQNSLLKE